MQKAGKVQFIAAGQLWFRILKWLSDAPPYRVMAESPPKEQPAAMQEFKAYAIVIINTIKVLLPLNPPYSEELRFFLERFGPNDPSPLTDFAASLTTASRDELQEVLGLTSVSRRMESVLVLLKKELEVARLQLKMRERVDEAMSDQQRKFFLRKQLKEIRKVLGIVKNDNTADIGPIQEPSHGFSAT